MKRLILFLGILFAFQLVFSTTSVLAQRGGPCTADFTCDQDVDAEDVTAFLEQFGRNQYSNPCPDCYDSPCPCQEPEKCPSPFGWCIDSSECGSGSGDCCCCKHIASPDFGFCLDAIECMTNPSGLYICF
jgi:hypothetical protein